MATSNFWRIARRRWYVAVAGALVTVVLALVAARVVPAKYEAKSTVLLLPPTSTKTAGGQNPFLSLSGYDAFADIVARAMTDTHTVQTLQTRGVDDSFEVVRDLTTNGPVVLVTVTGPDASHVLAELRSVVAAIPSVLTALQDNASVPANFQFTSEEITHPQTASAVRKSQIRAVLVAVVAGLFLAAMATVISDRLVLRRQRRYVARTTRDDVPPADGERPALERAEPIAGAGPPDVEDVDLDAEFAAVTSTRVQRPSPPERSPAAPAERAPQRSGPGARPAQRRRG